MGTWYFHAYPKAAGNDAHHAKGDKRSVTFGTVNNSVDATALFGRIWDLDQGGNAQGSITWGGRENLPTNRARTYHTRFRPGYTGASGVNGIFSIASPTTGGTAAPMHVSLTHIANGNLVIAIMKEDGVACVAANTIIVTGWSPTADTSYDMALVWDGTATASAVKLYIDGALAGSVTTLSSRVWPTPVNILMHPAISVGTACNANNTEISVEEFAIGDGADFDLSGFTGAARTTNVVGLAALDGGIYVPGFGGGLNFG